MSKVYFIHGTMGSGKSLDLIRAAYNYKERDQYVMVFKPVMDTRSAANINSRTGMSIDAILIRDGQEIADMIDGAVELQNVAAVFVDECNFLSADDVYTIVEMCGRWHIPVLFYGLKNTFQGDLFPAAAALFARADEVRECIGICKCGKRAKQNMRLLNNKPVFSGEMFQVGGNESYIAVCNHCFDKAKNCN